MPKPTGPAQTSADVAKKRRPIGVLLAVGAVLVLALLGVAWWLGLLTPEPDAVSLDATVENVQAQAEAASDASSDGETTEPQADAGGNEDASGGTPTVDIAGTWSVVVGDATFVGYRADSQAGEAVGRSPGVTGTLEATESQITSAEITADMTQLTSDSSLRDEHLGDDGIEYNTYPTSTFTLTSPIDVAVLPEEGATIAVEAAGDLTVRDVTQPVTIVLEGTMVGGELIIVGSTEITLADFGASISNTDQAIMEFSLVFSKG